MRPAALPCPDSPPPDRRKARWFLPVHRRNLPKLLFTNHRILEEAARAAAIQIALDEQHSFQLANPAHSGRNLGKARFPALRRCLCQRPLQVCVSHRRRAAGVSPKLTHVTIYAPRSTELKRLRPIGKATSAFVNKRKIPSCRSKARTDAIVADTSCRMRRHSAPAFRPPFLEFLPDTHPAHPSSTARWTN